jgi:hypothetical protein
VSSSVVARLDGSTSDDRGGRAKLARSRPWPLPGPCRWRSARSDPRGRAPTRLCERARAMGGCTATPQVVVDLRGPPRTFRLRGGADGAYVGRARQSRRSRARARKRWRHSD